MRRDGAVRDRGLHGRPQLQLAVLPPVAPAAARAQAVAKRMVDDFKQSGVDEDPRIFGPHKQPWKGTVEKKMEPNRGARRDNRVRGGALDYKSRDRLNQLDKLRKIATSRAEEIDDVADSLDIDIDKLASLGDFGGCSSSAGGWQGWEQKWAEQLNALRREHQVVLFQPRRAHRLRWVGLVLLGLLGSLLGRRRRPG